MPRQAIAYAIRNPETGNFLVETRLKDSKAYFGQTIFPGGSVENGESLEEALKREVLEETGLTNLRFDLISTPTQIVTPSGKIVHPFLITEFTGQLPKLIKDTGNPIKEMSLQELVTHESIILKQIAEGIIGLLNHQQ